MADLAEKYDVGQLSVNAILGYIETGDIAIPEIQRPFVWKPVQVRDLLDSLYNGFPTGYLIIWQNPNVRLKTGKDSVGKKILIDGQQRVTALMTAIAGIQILTDDYMEKTIRIAFNPLAEGEEERFAVQTPAHLKSPHWIKDISEIFKPDFFPVDYIPEYLNKNPNADKKKVSKAIERLVSIKNRLIGVITLKPILDIDEVTEIFVRINSKGATLNQADFAMSKIAADEKYGGNMLRKAIDYFCHLATEPSFYSQVSLDKEFMASDYAQKSKWLKDDKDDIYDPDYSDMLRVAFMFSFGRGKLADLVSLLSGRDFKDKKFKEEIAEDSFKQLNTGVLSFMQQFNFEQFVLAIKSAGFVSSKLLNSQITLDFAYTLYLLLHQGNEVQKIEIKKYIQKWFILSSLTGRYISSPESSMDRDLRNISEKGFLSFFKEIEEGYLSDTFWDVQLVQSLETSSITSPYFNVFIAAQIWGSDRSLLSSSSRVSDIISAGDVHHIFPKEYLKKEGITEKARYNQVANYVYLDTNVNISIGMRDPSDYFKAALEQCSNGKPTVGTIIDEKSFWKNLKVNCIPEEIVNMSSKDYSDFLQQRRVLMAKKIKEYYNSL
jgi:hypothetical protein